MAETGLFHRLGSEDPARSVSPRGNKGPCGEPILGYWFWLRLLGGHCECVCNLFGGFHVVQGPIVLVVHGLNYCSKMLKSISGVKSIHEREPRPSEREMV